MQTLRYDLAVVNDATKNSNIKIDAIKESDNENLVNRVVEICAKTGISCTKNDIDYTKRIGRKRGGHVRPVLVRFIRQGKRLKGLEKLEDAISLMYKCYNCHIRHS